MKHGEQIKSRIIATGLGLWRDDPAKVSARRIGQTLGLTHSAVLYHFGTTEAMRAAIAAEAVRIGDSVIVPLLIASRHPAAAGINAADRARFLSAC